MKRKRGGIGHRLAIFMAEKGWRQNDLAEKANLSRQLISHIMTGKVLEIRAVSLSKLAKALGTSMDYLFSGKKPEYVDPLKIDELIQERLKEKNFDCEFLIGIIEASRCSNRLKEYLISLIRSESEYAR